MMIITSTEREIDAFVVILFRRNTLEININ